MSINENLTSRVRTALSKATFVEEKRMFSGITFMVDGKMCISVSANRIMCRIDPEIHNEAIKREGSSTVIMKGHEYKGYVYVREEGIRTKEDFDYWIGLALEFNNRAMARAKTSDKV